MINKIFNLEHKISLFCTIRWFYWKIVVLINCVSLRHKLSSSHLCMIFFIHFLTKICIRRRVLGISCEIPSPHIWFKLFNQSVSLLSQLLTKAQKVSSGIFLNGPIVVYSKESLKKLQYFGNCQLFCSGNDFVIPPCTTKYFWKKS